MIKKYYYIVAYFFSNQNQSENEYKWFILEIKYKQK